VNGLYDVSVVTYPAYAQTTAAVRALEEVQAGEAQEALAAAKEVHKRESRKRQINIAAHAI
jgi:phage head maturation protease